MIKHLIQIVCRNLKVDLHVCRERFEQGAEHLHTELPRLHRYIVPLDHRHQHAFDDVLVTPLRPFAFSQNYKSHAQHFLFHWYICNRYGFLDQHSNHNGSINRSIDGMTSLLKGFGILILYDEKVNYGIAEVYTIKYHPKYKFDSDIFIKTKMIF